jgi:hypothetical protein
MMMMMMAAVMMMAVMMMVVMVVPHLLNQPTRGITRRAGELSRLRGQCHHQEPKEATKDVSKLALHVCFLKLWGSSPQRTYWPTYERDMNAGQSNTGGSTEARQLSRTRVWLGGASAPSATSTAQPCSRPCLRGRRRLDWLHWTRHHGAGTSRGHHDGRGLCPTLDAGRHHWGAWWVCAINVGGPAPSPIEVGRVTVP